MASLKCERRSTNWLSCCTAASLVSLSLVTLLTTSPVSADGPTGRWPMYRNDAGRSGSTEAALPKGLQVQWSRPLAPPAPAFRNGRLQFDVSYEPLIAEGLVIVGSSAQDHVAAYELATGQLRWRYFCDGPVRCAPVIWRDRVFFGADDGVLYTLRLESGALVRKQRLAVGPRMLLGNGRLTSVWPVRGGAVTADDKLYVACGVWPSEGVFVYCFDAETGEQLWHNDRLGYLFGGHPHNAEAFGGLAPQGYLLVDGDELIVPCSTAYPGRLNRHTGELIEFQLPLPGRKPGGWFASKSVRRGEVEFDPQINQQEHEDGPRNSGSTPGASREIHCAGQTLPFSRQFAGVEGDVTSMAFAAGHLVIATAEGKLYCLADRPAKTPKQFEPPSTKLDRQFDGLPFALRIGDVPSNAQLDPAYRWIVVCDAKAAAELREAWLQQGWLSAGRAALPVSLDELELPPYFAERIEVVEPLHRQSEFERVGKMLLKSLRPYGGTLVVDHESAGAWQSLTNKSDSEAVFEMGSAGEELRIVKRGALQGAANYEGQWKTTNDALVKAPLGVLWYDDALAHFKRSPQPSIIDGVMVSYPKDWHASREGNPPNTDYPLLAPVFSDIYSGRLLREGEVLKLRQRFKTTDSQAREPSQYRPPQQKNAWKPEQPLAGERINPLTGRTEPRAFPKSYGCDGGVDYGYLYSMRSGTAAFYDKSLESGTICVSGPRSGCTNSIIPAGGVLNVPYFFEGCTCSYPLPSGLALYSLPETYEQWASWGESDTKAIAEHGIERLGINFGAPGDRMTRDGTLWLEWPSVGGASPKLDVELEGDVTYRYQHSLRVSSGHGWPWVAASEAVGVRRVTIHQVRPGKYNVRAYVCGLHAPHDPAPQTITVDGLTERWDGSQPSHVVQWEQVTVGSDGKLTVDVEGKSPRLSGIEFAREGLALGDLVRY